MHACIVYHVIYRTYCIIKAHLYLYKYIYVPEYFLNFITKNSRKSKILHLHFEKVPFGIVSDEGIARLLCCSSLIISSPSFSLTDAGRLCGVVEKSKRRLWKNIRSFYAYGTIMGPDGLKEILQLGMSNFQILSIAGEFVC